MKERAFSLIELSIVLVILGLLTGGILAGKSLIRAAELRAVGTEITRLHTAMRTFQDKYFQVPGDFNSATRFWGTDTYGCPSHSSNQIPQTSTCDGNGNSFVDTFAERFRSIQHLANAGLLEGQYTGVTHGISNNNSVAGVNVPASRLANGGYTLWYYPVVTNDATLYDGAGGNIFTFGANTNGFPTVGPIISPAEAWNIDSKLDDGKPAFGLITSSKSTSSVNWANSCTTSDISATAEYALDRDGNRCVMVIRARL